MKNILLDLQIACKNTKGLPSKNDFTRWIYGIFPLYKKDIAMVIRLIDKEESFMFNHVYRGKKFPTNILAFPFKCHFKTKPLFLGDLLICKQIVERESRIYKKKEIHWAHLVIHGSLHLLGFSHDLKKKLFKWKG